LLEWLESSALARMVQESMWGYPIVLSSHAVGMAILVGLALMINFRVLGLASNVPLTALKTMFRIAWVGLVINVVSGTMLFVANADAFFESTPFWLKISLLVIGVTLLVMLSRRIPDAGESAQDYVPTPLVRWIAFLSSVAFFGVIVFGRLIAYWDWKDF
jgi:hypothetical protein